MVVPSKSSFVSPQRHLSNDIYQWFQDLISQFVTCFKFCASIQSIQSYMVQHLSALGAKILQLKFIQTFTNLFLFYFRLMPLQESVFFFFFSLTNKKSKPKKFACGYLGGMFLDFYENWHGYVTIFVLDLTQQSVLQRNSLSEKLKLIKCDVPAFFFNI